MLASDDQNPAFTGAHNPDDRLAVRFFIKPEQNNFRTQEEGRPVYEDREMVRIEVPGDARTVIETYVREEHKQRFPRQWLAFQTNRENPETGTPLSEWPLLSASQAEMLKAQKFRTVESIAHASDLQLQSIGMIAGMAPHSFRERARAFLDAASGTADVERMAQELAERDAKLAEQAEAIRLMQQQMAALMQQGAASATPGKRGPRKSREPAEAAQD
jgi:hypothetical protein